MTQFKVNNSVSVAEAVNKDFYSAIQAKGILGVQVSNALPNNITTPNINLPLGNLVYVRPRAIEMLTAPRVAEKFATDEKNGAWGDEAINIKLKEYAGSVSPDDGMSSDGYQVKTNYSNVLRGVYYYMTGWMATDLQEAKVGAAKENYRADQVDAAMTSLAIARNNYFFSGVATSAQETPIYGLMNDPNLPAYETVPAGTSATNPTYWANKTAEEIYNDVVLGIQSVMSRSAGKADDAIARGGHYAVGIATGSFTFLQRKNSFGKSAEAMLKETYGDKIDLFAVPQFNSADSSSDVFYVVCVANDVPTLVNSYVEMARTYPIKVEDSQVSQKISAATSGCIVQLPFFIARFNGIGASTVIA